MKAICAFLLAEPGAGADVLAVVDAQLRERYVRDHCGDDNWYQPLECLFPSGTSIVAEGQTALSSRYPVDNRWDALHRWMVDEAIADFVYFAKGEAPALRAKVVSAFPDDPTGTTREHANRALERMLPLLKEIGAAPPGDPKRPPSDLAREMVSRTRSSLTSVYDLLFEASLTDSVPFASSVDSPYVYRAFDLREGHEAPCMYIVDMHL